MITLDNLAFFSNPLAINIFIWFLFVAATGIFALVSAILIYHWTRYRLTAEIPKLLMLIYLGVGCIPILIMFSVALSYVPS